MKGKSLRRRQKNALDAQSGNLLKAQTGKASKWDALPAPPGKDDFKQSTSKRTREVARFMVCLMTLAAHIWSCFAFATCASPHMRAKHGPSEHWLNSCRSTTLQCRGCRDALFYYWRPCLAN